MSTRIRNFGWNRLKLATLSYEEIKTLEERVKQEHACNDGIHMYDKAGRDKLDALSWAVYNKQKQALLKKLNRRLNDAFGFQRTSGGKHTTISLSISECKSVLVALGELDKWQQESSTWKSVAEKQLAIAIEAENRNAELIHIISMHTVELGFGEKPITMAELIIAREGSGSDVLAAIRAAGITVKGDSE